MSKSTLFKKGFIVTVIVLFIGVSIVPSITGVIDVQLSDMVHNKYVLTKDTSGTTKYESISSYDVEPYEDIYHQSMFDVFEFGDLGQTAYGLTSADFNDDGNVDFAVSSATVPWTLSTISIFYNNGDLDFTRVDVYYIDFLLRYIEDLDSGDYDNDGDIDLIFTYSEYVELPEGFCKTNGTVNILFNDGTNNFGNERMAIRRCSDISELYGRFNPHLTSADYDMDGDIDLLVGDNSGMIEFYLNDGTGNFTSAGIIHDFGIFSWGLTSEDFDGDGDIDFLVSGEIMNCDGYVYFKSNQMIESNFVTCFEPGHGETLLSHNAIESMQMTPLDYENDGAVDFIAGLDNKLYTYSNKQGVYEPFFIGRLPDGSEGHPDFIDSGGLTSADYNNDGWDDFVVGGVQGVVRLCINKGSGQLPPKQPIVTGPPSGKVGKEISFTFIVEDSNGDDIFLFIDWVDDETEWIGPFPSSEEIVISHAWDKSNNYAPRVRAKDIHDDESSWTRFHIQISKSKAINNPFLKFLDSYPSMFPILRYVLWGDIFV